MAALKSRVSLTAIIFCAKNLQATYNLKFPKYTDGICHAMMQAALIRIQSKTRAMFGRQHFPRELAGDVKLLKYVDAEVAE